MRNLLFGLLLVIFIPLACQRLPTKGTSVSNQNVLHGVVLANDYDTYLNQIISLEKKYPITNQRILHFPVKVHVVNPLIGTELIEEDFSEALAYLNAQFYDSNIQFDFVEEGNEYIYSRQNVDYFYTNSVVEDFFTKKTYDEAVINLYIFDDYKDIVGYTHYPLLNLNRIFISKEHLTKPAFIHEMGHFFGLLHTFEKEITKASDMNNKNCEENGDKICDTPPDPFGASFTENDCRLFGDYKDSNGKAYHPDMSNFMSYYGSCRSQFSPQQKKLMYFIAKMIKYPQMRVRV